MDDEKKVLGEGDGGRFYRQNHLHDCIEPTLIYKLKIGRGTPGSSQIGAHTSVRILAPSKHRMVYSVQLLRMLTRNDKR